MPNLNEERRNRLPVDRDGLRFILPVVGLCAVLFVLRFPWAGTVVLLLAAYIAYFFRDPEREIPPGERLILSPADGHVVAIKPFPDWRGAFGEELVRISIFLSIFDVHVNRAPIRSVVGVVTHRPGRFKAAFAEAASEVNEQTLIHFASPDGDVWVKLIAGLIARRIVVRVGQGDKVAAGERIGLIRFGSRADCILPAKAELKVRRGQAVRGGTTVLAIIP